MREDCFGNLAIDALHWIQSGHGLLKNHGDILAAYPVHLAAGTAQQVLSLKEDFSGHIFSRRHGYQLHHRHGSSALATAAFADYAERLATAHGKAYAVHRRDFLSRRVKISPQVFHLQNVIHRATPLRLPYSAARPAAAPCGAALAFRDLGMDQALTFISFARMNCVQMQTNPRDC